eukprot:CAMPEP_0194393422 /NCGR_PEP_ID=MMETSP0174-20130528/123288_1 /TAXON_ID=216777 /ORGANISM="Proboscia alata, Strain PI-D3" /LENGTH=456 /DNA_ID=CAMNT_0039189103 /DNA_START=595 /DNA_END=1962 /DNA_ORIENTATION=-
MAKDPVPPDRPPPIKKRRRRPRTRRHRKQSRNNQPTTNSPIKSNTDLTAVLSSIINDIQKQSLITLCGIYKESIATVQNEIFLDLQNVLRHAISRLGTKLRAEFSNSKPKQKVFFKEYSRPPKHRQTRKKDILPEDTDQTETNFDENKNSDENAFSENDDNDLDANELGFGIDEGDGAAHRVSTRHPEMVHGHNFDCRVQTDDENGHIFTTEIDEEPRQFTMAKDPVPPDRPPPIKKRRRRPRTRRHRKQSRNNQPTTNSPIKSNTDLTAVLSSIINDIQKQSLITLCGIYKESIATVQNEIFLDLQNVLRHAISRLGTKLRAEFSNSKPKQKVFFKEYSRPPKHRPPTQKDTSKQEQKPRGFCDIRNHTDDEDFSDNDLDANELGFGLDEGDGAAQRENARHPEIVHGHNFDCRVQTADENRHFLTTEIDEENEKFSEEDSDGGNMNFSEGHSDN